MPVTVRPATPADHQAWLPLWRGYQEFYAVSLPEDTTASTWARFHDPASPLHCALAVGADDLPVGLVHLILHGSTWSAAPHCYLSDLFVPPELRGKGVGRALIAYAYDWARGRACSCVHWLTHQDNGAARALYDQVAVHRGHIRYEKILAD
ncbi:MAG: GNAT family N-acetyltransferase [Phenylobacterium sp.]|uniref:GNAT family N-acetyltransferase n=1 Tax=Phenylobacterium sp. TaxID=1871053 RepID=UPI002735A1E9|nr:GNAT family N-acetyltransferase [Phenylobacterium sp.]MDP3749558.1 GNAT family N-acetyltransferase [Phenylobacterium sp.]